MVEAMRRYVSGALVALFVSLPIAPGALAGQQPKPRLLRTLIDNDPGNESSEVEDRKSDLELARTIDRIRGAFERGDARELDAHLLPQGSMHVSLKSRGGEAGFYRRSQVMFMFEKLFDERQTRSFSFEAPELDSAGDSSSHVHAQWSYTVGDDEEVTEHLRFKFLRRGDDWFISEILTVPR